MTAKNRCFDLHCHSTASDGDLAPAELVARAHDCGVDVLAITDHDTFSGYEEARKAAMLHDIQLVTGIEFSCQWQKWGVHILGLNFDPASSIMCAAQDRQLRVREERAALIAERLVSRGLPEFLEDACRLSGNRHPGRPHFAQAMCAAGVVKTEQEAFKRYLGRGKPGDIQALWPDLETVVGWICAAGGTAVIAHPRKYDMSLTRLRALIAEFKSLGGEGIEVVTSGQKQGEQGMLSDLCRRFGMQASVGSDFHSPRFSWAELGRVSALPDNVEPVWANWALA